MSLVAACAAHAWRLQSSKVARARAHFYIAIDYPKYLEFLSQVCWYHRCCPPLPHPNILEPVTIVACALAPAASAAAAAAAAAAAKPRPQARHLLLCLRNKAQVFSRRPQERYSSTAALSVIRSVVLHGRFGAELARLLPSAVLARQSDCHARNGGGPLR